MNILDIILLCSVLIPGVIMGLRKGFIYQIVTLVALFAGAWLSFRFSGAVGAVLNSWFPSLGLPVTNAIAFTCIFIAVYFLCILLGRIIKRITTGLVGGLPDRLLGILFAVFKLALIVGIFVMLFDTFNTRFNLVSKESIDASFLYEYMLKFCKAVFPYLKNLLVNG